MKTDGWPVIRPELEGMRAGASDQCNDDPVGVAPRNRLPCERMDSGIVGALALVGPRSMQARSGFERLNSALRSQVTFTNKLSSGM